MCVGSVIYIKLFLLCGRQRKVEFLWLSGFQETTHKYMKKIFDKNEHLINLIYTDFWVSAVISIVFSKTYNEGYISGHIFWQNNKNSWYTVNRSKAEMRNIEDNGAHVLSHFEFGNFCVVLSLEVLSHRFGGYMPS